MSNHYSAISAADRAQCVEDVRGGISTAEACRKYGLSAPTLRLYCREAGIIKHKWLTTAEKALIASMQSDGVIHADIAAAIGKSQATVAGYIQRAGLAKRGSFRPEDIIDQLMELIKTTPVTVAARRLGISPNRARAFILQRQGGTNGSINKNPQSVPEVDQDHVGRQEDHIEVLDGEDDVGGTEDSRVLVDGEVNPNDCD